MSNIGGRAVLGGRPWLCVERAGGLPLCPVRRPPPGGRAAHVADARSRGETGGRRTRQALRPGGVEVQPCDGEKSHATRHGSPRGAWSSPLSQTPAPSALPLVATHTAFALERQRGLVSSSSVARSCAPPPSRREEGARGRQCWSACGGVEFRPGGGEKSRVARPGNDPSAGGPVLAAALVRLPFEHDVGDRAVSGDLRGSLVCATGEGIRAAVIPSAHESDCFGSR